MFQGLQLLYNIVLLFGLLDDKFMDDICVEFLYAIADCVQTNGVQLEVSSIKHSHGKSIGLGVFSLYDNGPGNSLHLDYWTVLTHCEDSGVWET